MGNNRMPAKGWYALRYEVLVRDNFTCKYCGQYAPNVRLEVDHVVPVVEGGTDALNNLVTSCWACNRGKEGLRARAYHRQTRRPTGATSRMTPGLGYKVLELLEANGPMSARDLGLLLGKTRAHISVVLNKLQSRDRVVKTGEGTWTLPAGDK